MTKHVPRTEWELFELGNDITAVCVVQVMHTRENMDHDNFVT